jgi:hypothetical protein
MFNNFPQTTCLTSECVEELDGVDGEDRMNRSRCCLKIGIDVLTKELDNVDKVICRSDSKLLISRRSSAHESQLTC